MTESEEQEEPLDVEDFIRRTTWEIWDRKLVGKIYDYYADDVTIHAARGDIVGVESVVFDTLQRLTAFPDTKMEILDVIWKGNERDGYHTSMLRTITATNTGPSMYGPPTGKTMHNNLGIANCIIRRINGEWRYVEEWVIYDVVGLKEACTPDEPLPS